MNNFILKVSVSSRIKFFRSAAGNVVGILQNTG